MKEQRKKGRKKWEKKKEIIVGISITFLKF